MSNLIDLMDDLTQLLSNPQQQKSRGNQGTEMTPDLRVYEGLRGQKLMT